MSKKGGLFQLIAAMSTAEKRHFRQYAKANSLSSNYLGLFEAIEGQKIYDEKAIKLQFKGKAFTRQLHVTKNYLQNFLLKSLRAFHQKPSKGAELKDLLRDVEWLFAKGLYHQCHYALEKAEKMGRVYELYAGLLEVLAWKRKLLLVRLGAGKSKELVTEILKEEKEILKRLMDLNEYWHLTYNVIDIFEDKAKSDEVKAHPLLNKIPNVDEIHAITLHYHILYVWNVLNGKGKQAEKNLEQMIKLLEKRPERIQDEPNAYMTALGNKIGMLLQTRQLEEVPDLIRKIRNVPMDFKIKNKQKISLKLLLRTYNIELELYRDTKQYEKGAVLIEEAKALIHKERKNISEEYLLQFYYQFAYIYFMQKDYSKALDWLNRLVNESFEESRVDLQIYARLLVLIIHLELDNIIVLKYAIAGYRRFLKKRRKLEKFEKILLRFFSKVCMAFPYQYPAMFRQLYADLFDGEEEILTSNHLDYLDFRAWIEGHLK